MISLSVIWRNLWRSPARTGLTIASVAVSLFLCMMLRAVVVSMEDLAADSNEQLRLVVHHKTTMTQLLPLAMGRRISQLPGVRAVCGARWFGGKLDNDNAQFPSLAADAAAFPVVYSDFGLTAAELDGWDRSRTAAVVGVGLAHRHGWTRGQRVALRSTVPPYAALEFDVVAITEAAAYPNIFVFRLDYLLETLRADGQSTADYADAVNFYWVKAASPAALARLTHQIDEAFANSPQATQTQREAVFIGRFARMFGDIPRMLTGVGMVVIATMLLVVGNTISLSLRERTGEFAVLKAVGCRTGTLVAMVAGEAMLMTTIGGVIGCAIALAVFRPTDAGALSIPYFPAVSLSVATLAGGVFAGSLVGAVAGIVPALAIARVPVARALRAVK